MRKKLLAAALILSLSLCLSGCSLPVAGTIYANCKPIENIQISESIGIDLEENGKTTVSICLRSQTQGGTPTKPTLSGDSIISAIGGAEMRIPKVNLFLADANYIMMGEDYARRGVEEFIDYIQRDVDVRGSANFFIVRQDRAQSLFSASAESKYTISDDLRALKKYVEHSGMGQVKTIINMARGLGERGVALVYAITISGKDEALVEKGNGSAVALPGGYCVLVDGKLVAFLNNEATRGVCLMQSVASNSRSVVNIEDSNITVQLLGQRARLKPVWEGTELKELRIIVRSDGMVLEMDKLVDITDKRIQAELNDAVGRLMADQITAAINASRELGVDFMDFSSHIEDKDPVKFAKLREHWPETWQTLPVTISVDVEIDKYTDIDGPQNFSGGL